VWCAAGSGGHGIEYGKSRLYGEYASSLSFELTRPRPRSRYSRVSIRVRDPPRTLTGCGPLHEHPSFRSALGVLSPHRPRSSPPLLHPGHHLRGPRRFSAVGNARARARQTSREDPMRPPRAGSDRPRTRGRDERTPVRRPPVRRLVPGDLQRRGRDRCRPFPPVAMAPLRWPGLWRKLASSPLFDQEGIPLRLLENLLPDGDRWLLSSPSP